MEATGRTCVLLGLVAAAVACTACGRGAGQASLGMLASDAMARYVPPGAKEIHVVRREPGQTLGKPQGAELIRELSAVAGIHQALVDNVAEEARTAGWEMTRRSDGKYKGSKSIDSTRVALDIVVARDRQPQTLLIDLRSLD